MKFPRSETDDKKGQENNHCILPNELLSSNLSQGSTKIQENIKALNFFKLSEADAHLFPFNEPILGSVFNHENTSLSIIQERIDEEDNDSQGIISIDNEKNDQQTLKFQESDKFAQVLSKGRIYLENKG